MTGTCDGRIYESVEAPETLAAGDGSYRIIKGILATGADTAHQEQVAAVHRAAATAAVPAFLRGPDSLFSDDLFLDTSPSGPAPVSATVLHLPTTSTTSPGTTSDTVTSTVTTSSTTNGDRGGPVSLVLDSGLREALKALRLTGMLATLDDNRLAQARDGRLGHVGVLQLLLEDELTRRATAALQLCRARFETAQATLEGFFTANPKLPATAIRDLAAGRCLANCESIIIYGTARGRHAPAALRPGGRGAARTTSTGCTRSCRSRR